MAHDIPEPGVAGAPARARQDQVIVGDQRSRVARTPRAHDPSDLAAGDALDRVEDVQHRKAGAIAAVHGVAGLGIVHQQVQRVNVRVGQVADMDVVAHAGAVVGVIIRAIDLDQLAPPKRRLDADLDEMRRAGRRLDRKSVV